MEFSSLPPNSIIFENPEIQSQMCGKQKKKAVFQTEVTRGEISRGLGTVWIIQNKTDVLKQDCRLQFNNRRYEYTVSHYNFFFP